MANPIQVLESIADAAQAVAPLVRTIKALGPLVEQTQDYIEGKRPTLPAELPESLKSDVELQRLEHLAAQAPQ